MKKAIKKIVKHIQENDVLYGFIFTGSCFAWFKFSWLMYSFTVSVWQIILIVTFPFIIYYFAFLLHSKRKRKFKTGDFVCTLSEPDEKYVVFDYQFWKPGYLTCKLIGSNYGLELHEKHLNYQINLFS